MMFRFRSGLRPDAAGGVYSAPLDPLGGLRETLLLRGWGGKRRGGDERDGGIGNRRAGKGKGEIPGSAHLRDSLLL